MQYLARTMLDVEPQTLAVTADDGTVVCQTEFTQPISHGAADEALTRFGWRHSTEWTAEYDLDDHDKLVLSGYTVQVEQVA